MYGSCCCWCRRERELILRTKLFLSLFLLARLSANAADSGADLFKNSCAACHGEAGIGLSGFAPMLAGTLSQHLASPSAAAYFSQVVVSGLSGKIESNGQIFAGAMPSQAALSNGNLVAILNYVTTQLNEAPQAFSIKLEDVEQARLKNLSSSEVRNLRKSILQEHK